MDYDANGKISWSKTTAPFGNNASPSGLENDMMGGGVNGVGSTRNISITINGGLVENLKYIQPHCMRALKGQKILSHRHCLRQ